MNTGKFLIFVQLATSQKSIFLLSKILLFQSLSDKYCTKEGCVKVSSHSGQIENYLLSEFVEPIKLGVTDRSTN